MPWCILILLFLLRGNTNKKVSIAKKLVCSSVWSDDLLQKKCSVPWCHCLQVHIDFHDFFCGCWEARYQTRDGESWPSCWIHCHAAYTCTSSSKALLWYVHCRLSWLEDPDVLMSHGITYLFLLLTLPHYRHKQSCFELYLYKTICDSKSSNNQNSDRSNAQALRVCLSPWSCHARKTQSHLHAESWTIGGQSRVPFYLSLPWTMCRG